MDMMDSMPSSTKVCALGSGLLFRLQPEQLHASVFNYVQNIGFDKSLPPSQDSSPWCKCPNTAP